MTSYEVLPCSVLKMFICCREAKRQAVVYSVIFALSQAVVYVMYAAAFRFGAYLIQVGDMSSTDVYRSVVHAY